MDFLALLKQAGFKEAEIRGETGLNSSPVTRGMLFYAVMPRIKTVHPLPMTVGAGKIQNLQQSSMGDLPSRKASQEKSEQGSTAAEEACSS
jgi:hypothetical protein